MDSKESRICHRCGTRVVGPCDVCIANLDTMLDPSQMTGEERAAEMEGWYGDQEIPFDLMFKRMAALVGRSVQDAEFILCGPSLIKEAREWKGDPEERAIRGMIHAIAHMLSDVDAPDITVIRMTIPRDFEDHDRGEGGYLN